MSLTPDEKLAGRAFREEQQTALEALHVLDPPTFVPVPWIKNWRHSCSRRGGVSTAMELKERYSLSPELWVCYCSTVSPPVLGSFPHEDCDGGRPLAPAGRFGFIFKEGKCSCGATARSNAGRLVDAYERPPMSGRVAR